MPQEWQTRALTWLITPEAQSAQSHPCHWQESDAAHTRHIHGTEYVRRTSVLSSDAVSQLPLGYHQLALQDGTNGAILAQTRLIVTPSTTYVPENLPPVWGTAIQLYTLKEDPHAHPHYEGMGDFTTLNRFNQWIKSQGGSFVGLNPLTTLNLVYPDTASPYSPISRLFLNPLYLDTHQVPGYADWAKTSEGQAFLSAPETQQHLSQARSANAVQYNAVGYVKLNTLRHLFDYFKANLSQSEHARSFEAYKTHHGALLTQLAIFQALQQQFQGQAWFHWPEEYRTPDSPAIERFAQQPENQTQIEFYQYLQWLTDTQLAALNTDPDARLALGLYMDLPVGADRGGFDTWRYQELYALDVSVGAPPDQLGPMGQNWGLPPFHPQKLRQAAYEPFIELLRTSMRHAGILRVDHALGLNRLYWITPNPENPRDSRHGLYVKNNLQEYLGIIALESHRNQCMVIGEDLGTVPPGVPEALAEWRLFSYRVGRWQKDSQQEGNPITPPETYPPYALGTFSLHDSSTLAGMITQWYWNLMANTFQTWSEDMQVAMNDEEDTLRKLIQVLQQEQLLSGEISLESLRQSFTPEVVEQNGTSAPEQFTAFSRALNQFMARIRCKLFIVQLEDILGMVKQVNIPGSSEAEQPIYEAPEEGRPYPVLRYPNWRQKMPLTLDALMQDARFQQAFAALNEGRKAATLLPV
jgi:4-alpha-glucanotransferase